jgi:hypothetical protein
MVMPIETTRDPRTVLVRDKYFTLRPKPLERWLWRQGLPQAAERVFWLHWEQGMRRGDWCSELSLKQVARECYIDISTVTRAYQVLKGLDLIRREDPGRDAANPFQQAIAVTEVRVPRDLLVDLARSPNRPQRLRTEANVVEAPASRGENIIHAQTMIAIQQAPPAAGPSRSKLNREESSALMRKLSETERAGFFFASRDRRTSMAFDEATALTPQERGMVLELLTQISTEVPRATEQLRRASATPGFGEFPKPRKLSPLEAARLRKRIGEFASSAAVAEVFRQVLWAVEEGALRRFDSRLAINIALKKIREGAWTRPNRMPPNWLRPAGPETCNAA